ncbi:unnamed protein product, partial [Allacma fusca]
PGPCLSGSVVVGQGPALVGQWCRPGPCLSGSVVSARALP